MAGKAQAVRQLSPFSHVAAVAFQCSNTKLVLGRFRSMQAHCCPA